jgi:IS5 family transposase
LKADRLDPDMLDERARQLLDYADPRDVTVLISHRDWPASGRKHAPLIGR